MNSFNFKLNFVVIVINLLIIIEIESNDCVHRSYGHGSTVCVCNATYCDKIDKIVPTSIGTFLIYTSNKYGLRFKKTNGTFLKEKPTNGGDMITINVNQQFQKIIGWGAAFTDTSGYNLNSVKELKNSILRSYFADDGLEYSLCRVPIGGTDMSLRYYTYDEHEGDSKLDYFNLTSEDFKYKIPIIKQALNLTNNSLKLFASSWNAPSWMLTNHKSIGIGFLDKKYYQTWTNYHMKFLNAYKTLGIDFWGITSGNEPAIGFIPFNEINSMAWLPWEQGKWISESFGPTIRNSTYMKLKIIGYDDQRLFLPIWLIAASHGNNALDYIDGIGVHWYTDSILPSLLRITHFFYPDKFILGTEATNGDLRFKNKVVLGSWRRGEYFADDIMEDLEQWVTGWVDWNLVLDLKGGPTYIENYVDASIIINKTAHEFYKQPAFYTLGHFSKFVPPESIKVQVNYKNKGARILAFKRPDQGIAVVIFNKHNKDIQITINDKRRGYINFNVTQRSINTILYW